MSIRKYLTRAIAVLALSGIFAGTALADSIRDFGKHIVHCRFVVTSELEEAVASQLKLTRADDRGALIVAVMEKPADGSMEHPIRGSVTAHWSDLSGMMGTITLHEVRDDAAIYYIGEFEIPKTRTISFDILIGVDENKPPYSLSFNRHFSQQ